jgi:hypothetical protein
MQDEPTADPAAGTVWLTGMPLNPAGTLKVNFGDLQVTGASNSTKTNLLLRLVNAPGIPQTIAEAIGQNFTHDFAQLMTKVSRAIDERRKGNILIRARIDDVKTGSLMATGQGLYLPVWGTGTASIQVLRR